MREFILAALTDLTECKGTEYAQAWVSYRLHFFYYFAKGRVTSTKHGLDFFNVVERALETRTYEHNSSEYDRNLALILAEHGVKTN